MASSRLGEPSTARHRSGEAAISMFLYVISLIRCNTNAALQFGIGIEKSRDIDRAIRFGDMRALFIARMHQSVRRVSLDDAPMDRLVDRLCRLPSDVKRRI